MWHTNILKAFALLIAGSCFTILMNAMRSQDPFVGVRQKLTDAYASSASDLITNGTIRKLPPLSGSLPPRIRTLAKHPPDLNFTFLLNSTKCSNDLDLVMMVLVHSAPSHFINRQLIRETWANKRWKEIQKFEVLFILGTSVNDAVQKEVAKESVEHDDIVQFDYWDSYRNMTNKNLAGLVYLSEYCWTPSYHFILKTDDDMLVYPRPIISYLNQQVYCNRHLQRTIFCAEMVKKDAVQRNTNSKWFIPWTSYSEKYYPKYCYGGGYILTRDLVAQLLETTAFVDYYWIDDVYVTGLLVREIEGVEHVQLPHQKPIKTYLCSPICMLENKRWFMHFLQKTEVLKSYYRPLKQNGTIVDGPNKKC